jgi:hypothetical protein
MTRVYLPATLGTLAEAQVCGEFPAGRSGHVVTAAIREWYVEGDLEELEYAAMAEAAQASLRLLAGEYDANERYENRRVVVAADIPDGAIAQDVESAVRWRSAVRVAIAVPLSSVVSVHVDDDDARGAVADAIRALPKADAGDDDAKFALDEAESHELLWYDVSEIADLV